MCILVLFYRVADDAPVIVGANREESYARPGEPPQVLEGPCRIVAGRDPKEGGTWLGVNEHGLLIAVTNRAKSSVPAESRSRGLLTRDLLGCRTAVQATEMATRELDENHYRGCNFLCADGEHATVIHGGDWLRTRALPPGIHVLANGDVNDESDVRVRFARQWLTRRDYDTATECLNEVKVVCARKEEPAICLHGAQGGTVSSSLIALRVAGNNEYWHAQGSPDEVAYKDYSRLVSTHDEPPG